MKQILNRYQIVVFFLLTYLLSWWAAPIMGGVLIPHGPMLAALVVVALAAGRQGLRRYWKQVTQWRAGWWYLVGPFIIAGYTGIAFAVCMLSGATPSAPVSFVSIGTLIQLLLLGGQWEEPGWTGYALPKLQERFAKYPKGGLIAVLVLGVFRALWHLPLLLYGKLYWFDIFLFSFALQIIIAWLYERSGKSVPAVMVFHFASNLAGAILSPVFAGAERLAFQALFMSLAMVFALLLIWFSQIRHGEQSVEAI